jgi:DNA repair protein RAD5
MMPSSGVIAFRGSTVVDCPETLQTGIDIVVSLSVYILPKAFKASTPIADDIQRNMFNEGLETLEEQELRERRSSLVQLFDSVGLRPIEGSGLVGKKALHELNSDDALKMTEGSHKPESKVVRKEVAGDGEEVEVEAEGDDLSENELDMIYKRWVKSKGSDNIQFTIHRAQQNDRQMQEMEPTDTFTLTLRGYQKQALL